MGIWREGLAHPKLPNQVECEAGSSPITTPCGAFSPGLPRGVVSPGFPYLRTVSSLLSLNRSLGHASGRKGNKVIPSPIAQ